MGFELLEPKKRQGLTEKFNVTMSVFFSQKRYTMQVFFSKLTIHDMGWQKGDFIEMLYDRAEGKLLLRKGLSGNMLKASKTGHYISRSLTMGAHQNPMPEKKMASTVVTYKITEEGLIIDLPKKETGDGI